MQTIDEMVQAANRGGQPTGYSGVRGAWYVTLARTRDSDTLERANFDVAQAELERASLVIGVDWDIERFNHWAVGWVDYLIVAPDHETSIATDSTDDWDWDEPGLIVVSQARLLAERWLDRLADYPILDEEVFSAVEWAEVESTIEAAIPGRWRGPEYAGLAGMIQSLAYDANGGPDYPEDPNQWWPSDALIVAGYRAWRREQRAADAVAS